jgi:ABC-2 type transport system ATP-binding protein
LSRGEYMKAMLVGALAFRPRLLLMDEPFTGVDVVAKDQLVRGLLDSVAQEECTVLIASHDLGELEPLADWVGFLDGSRLRLSEPMDVLRERYARVEVSGSGLLPPRFRPPREWMSFEQSDSRVTFLLERGSDPGAADVRTHFPPAAHVEMHPASLREVFVGLATSSIDASKQAVGS